MSITDFATWYSTNGVILLRKLRNGTYIPQGVKQVEITKPNGEVRKLGIPVTGYPASYRLSLNPYL